MNFLVMCILGARPSIWPQMDNLSGVNSFLKSHTPDFYSNSIIHSPRIFAIVIFKTLASVMSVDAISVLTFLGAVISLVGPPLFFAAVGKTVFPEKKLKVNAPQISIPIFLLFALNLKVLHKFEVNGFYINPFIQGATTSNIASVMFLFGIMLKKSSLRRAFISLSILIHISTGIFLVIVFIISKQAGINKIMVSIVRRSMILAATISLFIVTSWLYVRDNLASWRFYTTERAGNHFVITTEKEVAFQVVLVTSLICVIFLEAKKSSYRLSAAAYLGIGVAIICTAYPNYALPFALGAIGITLSKKTYLFTTSTITLLLLLSMQNVDIVELSIGFSMFFPGTRFVSLFSLYSLCVITVVISEKIADKLPRIKTQSLGNFAKSTVSLISAGVTLFGTHATYSNLSRDFSDLRAHVTREFPVGVNNSKPILPLGLDTQGWREFQNANVFVDDYPFWGDLGEYMNRSKFKSELELLMRNDQISQNQVELLLKAYKISFPITLVVSRKEKYHFGNLTCRKNSAHVICNLKNSNASSS